MPRLDKRTLPALPEPEPGKFDVVHWDDDLPGLGLRVLRSGARSWVVRYRIGSRQRVVTLGRVDALAPPKAREQARSILAKAKLGRDTRLEVAAARAQASDTLERLAEAYLAAAVDGRRSPGYARDVRRYLLVDARPLLAAPVAAVQRRDVAKRLGELAANAPVAADRCRAALASMFAWAMKQGLAEENPAAATARPAEPRPRERVLSSEELGAVWRATEGPGDGNAIARLLLLTGQRREEVGAMARAEIDLGRALWSIPGTRTKNSRGHDVPLAHQALAILEAQPERADRELVFGAGKGGFSGWSKAKAALDRRIALARAQARGRRKPSEADWLPPWRLHDLRRTAVTGMAELGVPPHVIEAVVNHVSGHKAGVAGVYNRATYAAEKRVALQAWANHLERLVSQGAPDPA